MVGAHRQLSALSLLVLLMASCSLFYQPATLYQCETRRDCVALGAGFSQTICEESLCVHPLASGGKTGSDDTGGQGGSAPECATNGDCIDANYGNPYLCRAGECIALTDPEHCPIVLGAGQDSENLRQPEPIVWGAYSKVDPTAPRLSVPTLNYELAIDEFNVGTRGGLPTGPGGTLRPFVAVVCSGTDEPNLDASLKHLIERVQVPALLASLYTTDLVQAFRQYGTTSDVFFLSPLEADSTLTSIDDEGRLWHMLTSASELAPAYVPLLANAEAYLRREAAVEPEQALRVAMVEAKTPFLSDLADELMVQLHFNGMSALQNEGEGNFARLRIDSALETVNPDVSAAIVELAEMRPHVVLAVTSSEFVSLASGLEAAWNPQLGPPPFYLGSPYLMGVSALLKPPLVGLSERFLGVNFAAAADSTLYDLYLSKLTSTYDVSFSLEGSENFYDAAYFLMYAIAASEPGKSIHGAGVAKGMLRLIDGPQRYEMGSAQVGQTVSALMNDSVATIELVGTMGPPRFDASTGARLGGPSIFCLEDGSFLQNAFHYDELSESIEGDPPCLPGFIE